MKPVESTGEKLTVQQRRRTDILECRRQIAKYQKLLKMLLEEGRGRD